MPSRAPHRGIRWPRAGILAILTLFAFAICLPVAAPDARAATNQWDQASSLTISQISPSIATGTADVVLTGTVTNRSTTTITPVIAVGLGTRPLDSTGRLQSWLSSDTDYMLSQAATVTLTALGTGATENWSLTVPKAAVPHIGSMASLPLSVTVSDTGGPVLRTVRSTLEVVTSDAVRRSLSVTWVVPLTLPADPALFGPTGTARTEAWRKAIGTDSTVTRLLDQLAGQPVTWLVDPRLVTEPEAQDDNLPTANASPTSTPTSPSSTPTTTSSPQSAGSGATGSATSTPDPSSTSPTTSGSTTPTPTTTSTSTAPPNPDDEVGNLIAALRTRLAGVTTTTATQQVWWTPLDDPDLSGLLRAGGSPAALRRTVAAGLPAELESISTQVVAAPATALGRSALTTLGRQWTAARGSAPVVLQPQRVVAAGTAADSSSHRATGTGGLILYDESLSGYLAGAADDGEGAAGARLLAYTMAVYLQAPANPRTIAALVPRSLIINPAQLAGRLATVRGADWIGDQTGQQTVAAVATASTVTVSDTPGSGTPYPPVGQTSISHAFLSRLEGERRRLTEFGSILVDSADVIDARVAALDDTLSTRWRASEGSGVKVLDQSASATDGLLARVSVSPGTVNFFADSGQLTVTVTNTLGRAVQNVGLSLVPRRAILRVDDPTQVLRLGAGGRATARFAVTAVAQGEVPIDATIATPGGLSLGTQDGRPTQLQVNVRPTSSWIYWVLGSLGGIVFVVGLIRAIRRGPRAAQPLDPTRPTPKDAVVTVTPSPPTNDTDAVGDAE